MYNLKPKASNTQTPPEVSQFIFELLRDKIKMGFIYDPCAGQGNLLEPWKKANYDTWGNDIDNQLFEQGLTNSSYDFLLVNIDWANSPYFQYNTVRIKDYPKLVLCNPPFNGYKGKLGSELWLDKIIELFGKEVPIVLFVPMGFRLNSKKNGKRWSKFTNQEYPPISNIISLPRDIFPGVEFHSEILIFNVPGLKPHYFLKNYEM